jgi:fermentation-respiration switch protein FrsA (DUF1100 family)
MSRMVVLLLALAGPLLAADSRSEKLELRGQTLTLQLYGQRGGPAAVVASGDGGWLHLGPEVAAFLASKGWFVVGLDSKAYLSAFTHGSTTLKTTDVPADFAALLTFAARGATGPALLVGVSEGAALAVLSAADPALKPLALGVVGLGLPDQAELGWRWRDSLIYLTHGNPDEPSFSSADFAGKLAPLPLVAIHSSKDEYVPVEEVKRVMERAAEPKQLWIVRAADHRFSDNPAELQRRLLEAVEWIRAHR